MILAASLGQGLFQFVGARIRDRITWQPVRAIDAIGGAALSAAAVLIVAWALGVAISGSRIEGVTRPVRSSAVLAKVNDVMPAAPATCLDAFNDVVGTTFFPRYLEPFSPEKIVEVKPGDKRILRDPDVERAGESVLKVRGTNDCGRGVEGSGFLYADDRLMTNAHVVAGVDDPEIEVGDDDVPATVVEYDSELDIAVLAFDSGSLDARCRSTTRTSPAESARQRRDPRLPRGRAVRRPGRPDPRPAAAALSRHLRRRQGDPRRLLAARPGPPGQLRRPDRQLGRRDRRRRVRGVGHRRGHRLRADDRRPQVAQAARPGVTTTDDAVSTGDCAG